MNYIHDIRVQLQTILAKNSNNDSVNAALTHVTQLEQELSIPNKSTMIVLVSDLKRLQEQGLWGLVAEQRRLIDSLSQDLKQLESPSVNKPDLSINLPPNSQKVPIVQVSTLPPELLEQINEVYLLHALATYPYRVLPSGKSLLSVFSSRSRHADESSSQAHKSLKDHVSEVVTRAFWDEVPNSLSSICPSKLKLPW